MELNKENLKKWVRDKKVYTYHQNYLIGYVNKDEMEFAKRILRNLCETFEINYDTLD